MSDLIGIPKGPSIIIALDYSSRDEVMALVDQLNPQWCSVKVGKELFTRTGPVLVKELIDKGFRVFLDLKFHDIPNTVERACRAAADLGVWMLNVHALGGMKMMEAAREAISSNGTQKPLLIAVTVLTSMNQAALDQIGLSGTPSEAVLRLASLANDSGLDGVVCSALEARMIRDALGSNFTLVTPGIRPRGSDLGDQQRVTTPADAIQIGVDYLVIGRPITAADNPLSALERIRKEIAEV